MSHLTVALAQVYPKLGSLHANLAHHLQILDDAAAQGAQLVIFPELSLTGYYLKDLVYELAQRPTADDPIFGQLLERTRQHSLDAVVGFVEEDARGRFYMASAYISCGDVLHVHRKIYLPTYGLFDDGRFFAPGETVRAFDTRFGRMGLLICEDFWHLSLPYLLWQDGADLMIFANSSPGRGLDTNERLASTRWVEMVNKAYGGMFANYVIQVNRVGYEDGLVFTGGSTVVDPEGDIVAQAPYFEAALLLHPLDLNQLRRTRSRLPLLRDERPEIVLRELQRILNAQPGAERR
ncbi:MAG: carbon-nitrogen hydrolase [Anaerolineae bacterium]|nr:carbon-nitrogen hydrolase [Anaerolineae bacterium]